MSVNLLLIFFVLVVVAMIAIILVQKGTGATAGSAFGSGASSTVFGAKGSGNFLTKTTMMLAFLFFAVSMFMAVQASKEFTVADSGEIDLGVVGTLDTSESDVPEMKPDSNDTAADEVDVPSLDGNSDNDTTEIDQVNDVLDGAEEKIDAIKTDVVDAVEEVKSEAEKVVDDTKDTLN
ncbi:MAG: preprotein translocase subunit SecG [Marinicellaceae bacterium]